MRFLPLLLLPALAHADPIRFTAGVGGGAFTYRVDPIDDPGQVSFQEIGGEVWSSWRNLNFGLQASVRNDTVDADEKPRSAADSILLIGIGAGPGSSSSDGAADGSGAKLVGGTRWRLAPYVSGHLLDFRWKLGAVAGSYYDPTRPPTDVWVFPQASIGLGNEWGSFDIGFLDSPAVASSADGGLGVLALRIGFVLAPHHRLKFGVGSSYQGPGYKSELGGTATGYLSYAYEAEFRSFSLQIGGYHSELTTGLWVALSSRLPW